MDIDEAITRVRTAAARVEQTLEDVAVAKQTLQREALKALVDVDGDAGQERDLVRRLYWDVPELPVKTLEAVVGPPTRVRELAGPGPALGTCPDCETVLYASSRTQLANGSTRCKPCERKRDAEERERRAREWDRASGPAWDWDADLNDDDIPPEWYEVLDDLQ